MKLINVFPSSVSQLFKNSIFTLDVEIYKDKIRYSIELPNNKYQLLQTAIYINNCIITDFANIESNSTHTLMVRREVCEYNIGNYLNGFVFLMLNAELEKQTNNRLSCIEQYLIIWDINKTYLIKNEEITHKINITKQMLNSMYNEFKLRQYKGV